MMTEHVTPDRATPDRATSWFSNGDNTTAAQTDAGQIGASTPSIIIYVAGHCSVSGYTLEVATWMRRHYPTVPIQVIDLEQAHAPLPEEVFATPTYLVNGRVWSLGNPSHAQVRALFAQWRVQESDEP